VIQPVICTIIAKNYLAHARTLARSFLKHHSHGRVFVLLVDEIDGYFDPSSEPFTTILARDLNIPFFSSMAFRYTLLELSTAIKPYLLEHLFDQYGLKRLCYFDPDITIQSSLDVIFSHLNDKLMVLTPHLLGFLEDGCQPDEFYILRAGAYNLGFIGVAQHPELKSFLGWWQRKLQKHSVVDTAHGLFVDQRWMDLAPGLFPDVHILRDPGCNVAYWNLNHRKVVRYGDGYLVNGSLLKFFHFSGLSINNIESVSRFQNRYSLHDLQELKELFCCYREELLANGHKIVQSWPYAYDYFDNGIRIPEFVRYLWREFDDRKRWAVPFAATSGDSFFAWLNEPYDRPSRKRILLTNLALEFLRRRSDIRLAYPDPLGTDRARFAGWFVKEARREYQLDDYFILPVSASIATTAILTSRPERRKVPTPISRLWLSPSSSILPFGGRIYLHLRDLLKRMGLTHRIEVRVGTKRIRKVRDFLFRGNPDLAGILAQWPPPSYPPTVGRVDPRLPSSQKAVSDVGDVNPEDKDSSSI
jgi:hypothetical protein